MSISAIYRLIKKYKETNSHLDQERTGRPALLNDEDKKKIDNWLREDDELSAVELQQLLYIIIIQKALSPWQEVAQI